MKMDDLMKWQKLEVKKIEDFCKKTYTRYTEYPSVRDIFYAFLDKLWPNTRSSYQGLVKFLVVKRLNSEIDWKIIRDGSGRELNKGDIRYENPKDYFEAWLHLFKTCADRYNLPKWTNQKNVVVVLCEKEADYPIVKSILSDLNVNIGYMRGYSGKRIMFEMVEEFKRSGKIPKIYLLGDFDPSGHDIKDNVRRDTVKLGMEIKPINLAITKKQIEKFKLPHRPEDEKKIEKLQKDPRFAKWPYGLYRVETASLRVRQPEYFDNLLRREVLKCFDKITYEEVKQKQKVEQDKIKNMIKNHSDIKENWGDD